MKATLEFNLDDPDDKENFNVYSHAMDLYLCLLSIDR